MSLPGELCERAFSNHPDANCVLYQNINCMDGAKGAKEMGTEDSLLDIEKATRTNETFEVESISVRQGCELIVYQGSNFYRKSIF